MAELDELRELRDNSDLLNKIEAAVWIAADTIRNESDQTANHANRLVWAKASIGNSEQVAEDMLKVLLAQNHTAAVGIITGADKTTILNAVNGAVDLFATGS